MILYLAVDHFSIISKHTFTFGEPYFTVNHIKQNCSYFVDDYFYTELFVETADTHPEQESVNSSEEQQTEAETKPALVDTNEMQRRFTALIDKVQPLLDTPDAEPTEWFSTGESATDTSVSECKAYLHLIDFDQEDTESISDLHSLFKLLIPYMNFQRFHILEAIVHQFKSAKARRKTQKYRDLLNAYQSRVNLGRFVQAVTR